MEPDRRIPVKRPTRGLWNQIPTDDHPCGFEDLAGLFDSNLANRGLCRLNIDEAAMLYKLVWEADPDLVWEIGRYFGGSTYLIASAMQAHTTLWSVDIRPLVDNEIEKRTLHPGFPEVILAKGDSKTIDVPPGDPDIVFIDGDHSWDGAYSDFKRFGSRLPVGGYLVFHDMAGSSPHQPLFTLRQTIRDLEEWEEYVVAGSLVVFVRV